MLQQLISGAEYTLGQYYSKGSRMNVLSHLRQLCVFCVAFNVTFLPVSRDTLLGFIELMSRTSGYEHIEHILSSIRFINNYKGLIYPGDSFEFKILVNMYCMLVLVVMSRFARKSLITIFTDPIHLYLVLCNLSL